MPRHDVITINYDRLPEAQRDWLANIKAITGLSLGDICGTLLSSYIAECIERKEATRDVPGIECRTCGVVYPSAMVDDTGQCSDCRKNEAAIRGDDC